MDQSRLLKQSVFEMYKSRREGDLLMDAPVSNSCRDLTTYVWNRKFWGARVRAMRKPRVAVEVSGEQVVEGATLSFTVSN